MSAIEPVSRPKRGLFHWRSPGNPNTVNIVPSVPESSVLAGTENSVRNKVADAKPPRKDRESEDQVSIADAWRETLERAIDENRTLKARLLEAQTVADKHRLDCGQQILSSRTREEQLKSVNAAIQAKLNQSVTEKRELAQKVLTQIEELEAVYAERDSLRAECDDLKGERDSLKTALGYSEKRDAAIVEDRAKLANDYAALQNELENARNLSAEFASNNAVFEKTIKKKDNLLEQLAADLSYTASRFKFEADLRKEEAKKREDLEFHCEDLTARIEKAHISLCTLQGLRREVKRQLRQLAKTEAQKERWLSILDIFKSTILTMEERLKAPLVSPLVSATPSSSSRRHSI